MTDSTGSPSPSPESRSVVPGVVLIVLGLLFFANNLLRMDFTGFWPVFLLIPAVVFVIVYIRDRRQYGVLMPATILTVYAALFFACQNGGWGQMSELWPTFILAPGLGFFVLYLFGKREPGLLIPASILTGLSVIFFFTLSGFPEYWPSILILIGLVILLRPATWRRSSPGNQNTTPGV
ncbi:MAG TPA: hypothetical protein VMG09_15825 [Bacteroidota bacterium]|nr:hypothetical protein [Bacteroidota bacterium]